MSRLLFWLTGRLPCRIISDNGQPYLERYYLGTVLGVRFYIHRFVGSDPDRGLHDHPWPWAGSLVLKGWYFEELRGPHRSNVPGQIVPVRQVRWFNWLTGDSFHRVILPGAHCWTLFFHRAAYTKPWGFLQQVDADSTMRVWVPHNYPKDGNGTPGAWWNEVPIGILEPRRLPL